MPDLMKRAQDRRAELVQELAEIDEFLELARRLEGRLGKEGDDAPSRRPTAAVRPTSSAETARVAREVIEARGRPVPLTELLAEVIARGVDVGGKEPKSTLSARLSNTKEFTSDRRLGWWLKDRPLPPELSGYAEKETAATAREADAAVSHSAEGGTNDAAALAFDDDRA